MVGSAVSGPFFYKIAYFFLRLRRASLGVLNCYCLGRPQPGYAIA